MLVPVVVLSRVALAEHLGTGSKDVGGTRPTRGRFGRMRETGLVCTRTNTTVVLCWRSRSAGSTLGGGLVYANGLTGGLGSETETEHARVRRNGNG